MKISGSYTIDAPRDEVWAALNDLGVLARVVPGCERLEQTGENEFEGTVKIGIASIRGTYSGRIRLEDVQPPTHYKLVANGKSASGVVDGAGTVDLEEQGDKTLLRYGGDAQVGGVLASVGQRLIEGASKQLINQSLKALAAQVAQRRAPEAAAAPEPATPPSAPAEASAPSGVLAEAAVAAPTGGPSATGTEVPGREESSRSPTVFAPPNNGVAPQTEASTPVARRTVIVPPEEQLKPESVFFGVAQDFVAERPWFPWVVVAFLLGYLFGSARGK